MIKVLKNLPNKYLYYFGFMFVGVFISLAYWQFTSYQEDKLLNERLTYSETPIPILISEINEKEEFSSIQTLENLVIIKSWLLRSRVNNGISGYHLITLLQNIDNQTLIVNNGWVPLSTEVTNLPKVAQKNYVGKLYSYDEKPSIGQDDILFSDYLFRIDKNFIEKETGATLPLFYLQLTENCGTEIICIETVNQYQAPHLGYAFQWMFFALCLSFVVLKKNKLI